MTHPARRPSPDAPLRARPPKEPPRGGVRLFAGLVAFGVLAAGFAYSASADWYDRQGRTAVMAAGLTLAVPRAGIAVGNAGEGAGLVLSASLRELAAMEDLLAPSPGDGELSLTILPYAEAGLAPPDGCAGPVLRRCAASWRDGPRWITLSWPEALQADRTEMERFGRRLMARWAPRAQTGGKV